MTWDSGYQGPLPAFASDFRAVRLFLPPSLSRIFFLVSPSLRRSEAALCVYLFVLPLLSS